MPCEGKATKKSKGTSTISVCNGCVYREDWDILWVDREVIYDVLNHTHLQQH